MARANSDRRQSHRHRDPTEGRGRTATSPASIPRRGWWDVALRVKDEIGNDHVSVVAAGVAFYALLASFPAIAAIVAIAGIVIDPAQVEQQMQALIAMLPEDAAAILEEQARKVVSKGGTAMSLGAVAGLLLTLYSASAGMRNLMVGMNIAYDEAEDRGFIKKLLVSLVLTLGLIVGFILAIACIIALPIVISFMSLGETVEAMLNYLRWPLLAMFMMMGLAIIYRFAPNRSDPKWRWVSVGAVVATVLWVVASIGFSIYVRNFASYNETYGSLGAVIILLMWLWISAFVILLGAELNAELEHQTEHDTTTGEAQPMGKRGAVKADTRPRRRG